MIEAGRACSDAVAVAIGGVAAVVTSMVTIGASAGPPPPGDPFAVVGVAGELYAFTEVSVAGGRTLCRDFDTIPLDDVDEVAATVNLAKACDGPSVDGSAMAGTGVVATGTGGTWLVAGNGGGSAFCGDGASAFSRHDVLAMFQLAPGLVGTVRLHWTAEAFGLGAAQFRLRSEDGHIDHERAVSSYIAPVLESGTIDLALDGITDWTLQLVTTHQSSDFGDGPDSEFTVGFASVILEFEVLATGSGADLDGDGRVNASDLGLLLAAWGPCEGCRADLVPDGRVDAADLGRILADWES